jgi:hypothetical protein
MNDTESLDSLSRPLPGTGRLGVVSAYFTLYGLASAAVTIGVVAAVFLPRLGWHITPSNPWIAIPGAALMTFGFFRTTRLLRQRRRAGATLAAVCVAASLAASFYTRDVSWISLGAPLLGLGLLASAWRHLE